MKSHRIILISRGECFTNTDESKFATEKEPAQSGEVGERLKELVVFCQ